MAEIFGWASLTVDGEPLLVAGGGTFVESGKTLSSKVGPDGRVHGRLQTGRVGRLTVTITAADPKALAAIRAKTAATVVATTPSGRAAMVRNAAAVSDWSYNFENGDVQAEWEGEATWLS